MAERSNATISCFDVWVPPIACHPPSQPLADFIRIGPPRRHLGSAVSILADRRVYIRGKIPPCIETCRRGTFMARLSASLQNERKRAPGQTGPIIHMPVSLPASSSLEPGRPGPSAIGHSGLYMVRTPCRLYYCNVMLRFLDGLPALQSKSARFGTLP